MNHLRNRQFGLYTSNRTFPALEETHKRHISHNLAAYLYSEHSNRSSDTIIYNSPHDIVADISVNFQTNSIHSLEITTIAVSHPDTRLLAPQQVVFVTENEKTVVLISGTRPFATIIVQILELVSISPPIMIHRLTLAPTTLLSTLEQLEVDDVNMVYTVKTTNDALRLIKVSIPEKDFRALKDPGPVAESLQNYLHRTSGINFSKLELALVSSSQVVVLRTRVSMAQPEKIIPVIMAQEKSGNEDENAREA